MRMAELVMAVVLALFSAYLMWKSTELPIGWTPGEGPGGGAFPFWLAVGMLLSSIAVIVRWVMRASPQSRSTEPYLDRHGLRQFLIAAGALTAMVGLIHIIGVYGAVPAFLVFYMRIVGRHAWPTTVGLAGLTPVALFFFFDIALRIPLPKGFTEPLFFPLYDIFY